MLPVTFLSFNKYSIFLRSPNSLIFVLTVVGNFLKLGGGGERLFSIGDEALLTLPPEDKARLACISVQAQFRNSED
jgi:hypothetical protein